jgi:hydroxyethylthiazole kinase
LVDFRFQSFSENAGAPLLAVREKRPLIQCVTNFVSMDLVANALHALGASPAMSSAPEEAEEFAARADAIVCNIGTLSRDRVESLEAVAAAAQRNRKPWVLDPVGVGATGFRNRTALDLLRHKPAIIRGNASEIMALAKLAGVAGPDATPRGVDAAHDADAAISAAIALAIARDCVVIATGRVDVVTDGARVVRIASGSPVMARVTAMGCALSATAAAFLAVTDDRLAAGVAAAAVFGVAGQLAGAEGVGPGAFRVDFLDRLYDLTPRRLADLLDLTEGAAGDLSDRSRAS